VACCRGGAAVAAAERRAEAHERGEMESERKTHLVMETREG
jgi:hypothetical protein